MFKLFVIFLLVFLPFITFAESPRVDIAYPNGGEVFFSNTNNTIYWKGDSSEKVSIYFRTSVESDWSLIAKDVTGNKHNWLVPEIISNSYNIKLEREFENENLNIVKNYTYASLRGAGFSKVFETDDNSLILAGTIPYSGGDVKIYYGYLDIWLIKVNKSGDILWQNTYGTTGKDELIDIIQLDDNGYLISAVADSANIDATKNEGSEDILLIRLDENGNKLWSKSYGGLHRDIGISLIVDKDGNYLLCGNTASDQADFYRDVSQKDDAFIMKIDKQGEKVWTKFFVGEMWEEITRVFSTNDGYTIVGHTNSTKGDFERMSEEKDIFIKKLDNDWNTLKTLYIGGSGNERVYNSVMSDDKTLYICGFTLSNDLDFANKKVNNAGFIGSISSELEINWLNTYGGSGENRFGDIFLNDDGTLSAIGGTTSNDGDVDNNKGGEDAWYINLDLSGNTLWSKTYGGSYDDSFYSFCETNHKFICGATGSSDYDLSTREDYGNKAWLATMTEEPISRVDTADNNFAVIPQPKSEIKIKSPKTKYYSPNEPVHIEWMDNESQFVKLSYSTNNGNDWILIKDSIQNNTYDWFPTDLNNHDCIIRIEDRVKVFEETAIEWDRNYSPGSSYNFLSIESYDNGIVVICKTDNSGHDKNSLKRGEDDIWVFELDSLGKIKWQNTFGGDSTDIIYDIIKTKDKNYLMVGCTKSNSHGLHNEGAEDYWIVKFDRSGREIFSINYGGNRGEIATNVIEANDGYLVYGTMWSDTNKYINVPRWSIYNWVMKIDKNGQLINSKLDDYTQIVSKAEFILKDSNTIQIIGNPKPVSSPEYITKNIVSPYFAGFALKEIDFDGNVTWKKDIANNRFMRSKFAFNNKDNSTTIIALTSDRYETNERDVYLYRVNFDGDLTDSLKIESLDINNIKAVSRAGDLGYYIAYQTKADSSNSNGVYGLLGLAKIDENGKLLWKKKYGGSYWDGDPIVNVMKDNSFVMIGNCRSYDGDVSRNHFSNRTNYRDGDYATWIVKFRKTHYPVYSDIELKFGNEHNDILFIVYPNITTGDVKIKVKLEEESYSTINLYDNLGRQVEVLFEGNLSANEEIFNYNTKSLAPGRYYVNLKINEFETTKVLEVLR